MKRIFAIFVILVAVVGCQKEHPVSVYVNASFTKPKKGEAAIVKIAVLPFVSAVHPTEDPDGVAAPTMEKFFVPLLDARKDYRFISSGTVQFAVEREDWVEQYAEFLRTYPRANKPDMTFLSPLAEALKCDAFLIPVVDVWQKDEVDPREDASPTTYVGATVTIVDARNTPGAVLFRATDEAYMEGAYAQAGDRGVISSGGSIRSDQGARSFKAPPFEDVIPKVVEALVQSLPQR